MSEKHIADITTGGEDLPRVRIDGELYPLRLNADSSEWARFKRLGRQYQDLTAKDTEADDVAAHEVLVKMGKLALDAPDAVHARLTDVQRLNIVKIYGDEMGKALPFARRGGASSPESSASSEADPETGEG